MSIFREVRIGDGTNPNLDAFGRLRVSEPTTLFDSKQLFDSQPLFFDEVTISGGSSSHSISGACTHMSVSANDDAVIRQSKMRFNYQPGKAIRKGEPVLTPNGFVAIEMLKVGDEVFDGDGKITNVKGMAEWKNRKTYRITFDDGTHVDADEEHDWSVIVRQNSQKGEIKVISVKQMLEEYGNYPPSFARWRIPSSPDLEICKKEVPIDPYTLGLILGDGHIYENGSVQFTTGDIEILENIVCQEVSKHDRKFSYGLKGLSRSIKELKLDGKLSFNKFIPDIYLYNEKNVRLEILRGLMDSDGTVDKRDGTTEFNSASKELAENIAFLVRSIGGQAKIKRKKSSYINEMNERVMCMDSYRVRVISPECPFKLERKKIYWKPRTRISFDRYIHSIEYIGEFDTVCIEVESNAHTYLTRNNIVTHNSLSFFCSFVLGDTVANTTKRVGYFNSNTTTPWESDFDGLYIEDNGTDVGVCQSKSGVVTRVSQSSWNVDKLDGTGSSGITIDWSKSQILVVDLEWLGVGRSRFGFVIDGFLYYVHTFNNSNNLDSVYMSSPNHSIRYEIRSTGGTATMQHICSSVQSEGGLQDLGVIRAFSNTTTVTVASSGTTYPIIGIRQKSTHLSRTVNVLNVALLIVTGTDQVRWSLQLNPTLSSTLSYSDETNSGIQTAVGDGSITVSTPGIIIDLGFAVSAGAAGGNAGALSEKISNALRLGANIDGTRDEMVLCCTPISSSTGVRGSITWRELV